MKSNLNVWMSRWRKWRMMADEASATKTEVPVSVEGAIHAKESVGAGLDNKAWLGLVEECADFLRELDEMTPRLLPAAQPTCEHVKTRLLEILERAGVTRIESETRFDIARHQAWPPQRAAQGAAVAETLDPGLAVGPRVLKRARVKVSDMPRVHVGSAHA